jgi:hypothetical protein
MVMLKVLVMLVPVHVFPAFVKVGVTVKFAVKGAVPKFEIGKVLIDPVPEVGIPIEGW